MTRTTEPTSSAAAPRPTGTQRYAQDAPGSRARVVVEAVTPQVDGGRFPAKRVVGERVDVEADVFADGHDAVAGVLLWKKEGDEGWREAPLAPIGNDRWRAGFVPDELGRYLYTVRAWIDAFGTWRRDLAKRVAAGQDVTVELAVGARLVREAAAVARAVDASALAGWADALEAPGKASGAADGRVELALGSGLAEAMARSSPRLFAVTHARELAVVVEPLLARFSAWYELFPRSCSPVPGRHGTLRDVEARLPYVAELGFDVLYLPPIHPIGATLRKGPNNSVSSTAQDVGSPWAIGGAAGGHTAIHPELGTLEDLRSLVAAARALRIEIALDVAFQCSPDHPWVREHRSWFRERPDGTIQYAENPPKKYQDIYPLDFESEDAAELWRELRAVFLFWIEQGVTVFRVDNPHTKSLRFWEWCIGTVKEEHPEAIFLSEAFTRPRPMQRLAKAGFSQSYTYFPWRNTKAELTAYFTELARGPVLEYLRPNHWPNTPDILPEFLQTGGRAGFLIRLVLAATLGASYGIYGPAFELCEDRPLREGGEEYLDSEKYQLRAWELDAPHSLRHFVARVNRIRREHPALQSDRGLSFHATDAEHVLAYSKVAGDDVVLVVVNLDPHHAHSAWVHLDREQLGVPAEGSFQVHDLLSDARYLWQGEAGYVELDPEVVPAHVFRIRKRLRSERDFDYFL